MLRKLIFAVAAMTVLAGTVIGQTGADPASPDIRALLRQVREHQQAVEEMKEKYTCIETLTTRKPNAGGVLAEQETTTYEVTFYKGERIRRLAARNGRPLSANDEAKAAREVERQIRGIDKRLPELERKRREARARGEEEDEMGISYLLRTSRLRHPRQESFRGREVIVFDFEPNPDYKPRTAFEKSEHRFKVAGKMWIDAVDMQVARVEATLVQGLKIGGGLVASVKPGANFVFEQERVNNEVWLPTYEEANYTARMLFVRSNSHTVARYSNYKRFDVESEKEKIKISGIE